MGRGAERNRPCPCGSGLKYKKCCGSIEHPPPLGPDFETEFDEMFRFHEHTIKPRLEAELRRVNEDTRSTPKYKASRDDPERINCLIQATEETAADLLRQFSHTRQFWYQCLLRFAPVALKKYAYVPSDSDDPGFVRRATMRAACLPIRYLPATPPHEWAVRPGIEPIAYALDREEFTALLTLSFLGAFRVNLENAYRIASKGAPVQLGPDSWRIGAEPSDAIRKYESRRDRFETRLGRAGFWLDPGTLHPKRPQLCGAWQVLPAPNHSEFRIVSKTPSFEITGRWLPTPYFDLGWLRNQIGAPVAKSHASSGASLVRAILPYDALLAMSPRAVEVALDITAEKLTVFLYALYRMVPEQIPWRYLDAIPGRALAFCVQWPREVSAEDRWSGLLRLRDVCVSGFLRSTPDDWAKHLALHAHHIFEETGLANLDEDECQEIVSKLTQGTLGESVEIPYLWTLLSEKTLVLDLWHAFDFFYELFLVVGRAAERLRGAKKDQRRANIHEEHAGTFFARELGIDNPRMLVSKRIKAGSVKSDVDIAFAYGRTLFMIDCKATAKDGAYYAGAHNKWRNRLDIFATELETKCPERVDLIRSGAARPIIAPEDFDSAVSLVCMTTVEYLPDDEPSFWRDDLARVGPPEELLVLIRRVAKERGSARRSDSARV